MTDTVSAQPAPIRTDSPVGAGWFLRRALMTILIFCVAIGGIAWLLHASIDQTTEAIAADQTAGSPIGTSSIRK